MIWIDLQIGPQKLFAGWLVASTRRLDGDEDRIQAGQRLGVVASQYPPLVRVVLVEQPQAHRARPIAPASPDLERYLALVARLAIEIESVKDQRTLLRIEDASKLLGGFAVLICVKDIGYI